MKTRFGVEVAEHVCIGYMCTTCENADRWDTIATLRAERDDARAEVDRLRAELARVTAQRDELAAGVIRAHGGTIHGK